MTVEITNHICHLFIEDWDSLNRIITRLITHYSLSLNTISRETGHTLLYQLGLNNSFKTIAYWIHQNLVRFDSDALCNVHIDFGKAGDTLLHLATSRDHYCFVLYLVKYLFEKNNIIIDIIKAAKKSRFGNSEFDNEYACLQILSLVMILNFSWLTKLLFNIKYF